MAGLIVALLVGITFVLMCNVQCNEDIVSVNNRIDGLDEDIIQLELGLVRVKERIQRQIDSANVALRSELKQHISEHVREAIAGILQGESIEEMVKSQVIAEVRQLRRGNHQMKRRLHRVLMSLRDVQEEMNTYKDTLVKAAKDSSEMKVCSKYIMESESVKTDIRKYKLQTEKCKQDMDQKDNLILEMKQNIESLHQTCQLQLRQVNQSTTTTQGLRSASGSTTTSASSVTSSTTTRQGVTSSSGSTTTTTAMATSTTTTTKPEKQRSRIIVAPLWSATQHQFRQLNIDSNTVSNYQLRSLKNVVAVAYVSKQRKMLIGLHNPHKIISSNLDSYDMITMREYVRTQGMAVDEEREIVFLTTSQPRYTISRMTTQGKHFTAITNLSKYGNVPRSVAVNSKERKIYYCSYDKVFTVTYEGHGLQTLATGSHMYAVTLDNTGSILYYNIGKTLLRMTLSDSVVTNVTTLNGTPTTIIYYINTVYYSTYASSPGMIGAVDMGYNIESYVLQTISLKGTRHYAICLVP